MLYHVSYDLNQKDRDYPPLIAYLKKLGAIRVLYSEWLLVSTLEPGPLCDDIYKNGKMDANDRLLIIECTGNAAWKPSLLVTKEEASKFFQKARSAR